MIIHKGPITERIIMSDRRVVFISEISVGSKFRLIANRAASAAKKKSKGTQWASCALTKEQGNLSSAFRGTGPANPQHRYTLVNNPTFGWIRVYPPEFSVQNKPCPKRWNYHFPQRAY
jgi:hypothetical protein